MANPFSRGGVSRKDAKAMGDMLAGGKSSARGSIYSRMMREPQPEARLLSSRGIVALVLLIALPPVGIAFVWRMRMFMPRGRALLTALSTLILAVMVAIVMPTSDMQTVTPSPAMQILFQRGKHAGRGGFEPHHPVVRRAWRQRYHAAAGLHCRWRSILSCVQPVWRHRTHLDDHAGGNGGAFAFALPRLPAAHAVQLTP